MKRITSISEAIDGVRETLGTEFENEYDVEGIAREITDYDEDGMYADFDREDYWHIVAQYAC